jgi:hypothetical protein
VRTRRRWAARVARAARGRERVARPPRALKWGGRPPMPCDWVIQRAKPPKNMSEVRVTTKAGMRATTTARPLKSPMPAPVASMRARAPGTAQGEPRSQPVSPFIVIAPSTLVTATIEPTERSMPPPTSTNVWPTASRRRGSNVVRIDSRFAPEAKPGVNGARRTK